MTTHDPERDPDDADTGTPHEVHSGHDVPRWMRFMERGTTIMMLGGIGSLVFSFFALGILPLGELSGEVRRSTPATYQPMNELEQAGFAVYKREGCAYCHSTFVRDTPSDVARFGPPAEAWEFQDQYPQQWGTRRIGPDLSRESGKRSDGWQYAHLFNPRSTVPQSIMPSYPWMFEDSASGELVPTKEARGLVAYLNYLGRAIDEAGPQTQRGKDAVNGVFGQQGH